MGDVVIFLCFGPLLQQAIALGLTDQFQFGILPFCYGYTIMTNMILHGNNMRDLESDRKAGCFTLCVLIGSSLATLLYVVGIMGAYGSSLYLAMTLGYRGAYLTFLTLPIYGGLVKRALQGGDSLKSIDEDAGFGQMVFGVLLA